VQTVLLEEAVQVFRAAGVRAEPASGVGQTAEELLEHFRAGGSAPDTSGGVYNSTWQNLHHRRPRLENAFYHGEILELGRSHGLEAPVNARVLALLEEVHARELGPEPFSPAAFRERFADLIDFPPPGEESASPDAGGLEI
jgi:ketopantoate reductase